MSRIRESSAEQKAKRRRTDRTQGAGCALASVFAAPVEWPDGETRDAVVLEGLVIGRLPNEAPYPIAWRSITPRAGDAVNLLNPVTLSATSVAYSSIRMELTFMMLGEAAGTAAALAVDSDADVQEISYAQLRERLTDGGLVLELD